MAALGSLARLAYRRRWALLIAFAVLLVGAALYGAGAPRALTLGGLQAPHSESARAAKILDETFALGGSDVLVAYSHPSATVHDPVFAQALGPTLARLQRSPDVERVSSPYPPAANALVSRDGHAVVVSVTLAGRRSDAAAQAAFRRIEPLLRAPGLSTAVGGPVPGTLQAQQTAVRDLARGELITLPLVALLLVVFFRGPVLALLPLMVGAFAVVGALCGLRLLAQVTEVSTFALNIVTFLGLGVAIDYSLFMTSRFRDELAAGPDVATALARTVSAAGRTIAFSGLAVATSLLGILVFPLVLLRSVAIAGTIVVCMALLATLLFLPAALGVLGKRIEWGSFGRRGSAPGGAWHRIAHLVMRAPLAVALGATALLLVLGAPFLRIRQSVGGVEALPPRSEARAVAELLQSDRFAPGAATPILIVVDAGAPVMSPQGLAAVERHANAVAALPGVSSVDAVVGGSSGRTAEQLLARLQGPGGTSPGAARLASLVRGNLTVVRASSSLPRGSTESGALIRRLRAVEVPGTHALVGGEAARLADLRAEVGAHLPWAVTLVCLATLVVLFLAFGSIVMPIKAVVMNALSLAASFGALVWIFQDGRLERLLGYHSPGAIDVTIPIMTFAVVFGLAMDYELFLLSRIREDYLETHDTRGSVARGLERTGRIITRAAVLLIAVMMGFVSADMLLVKEIGVSMAVAIAVDATIVRALLVPATMVLLGRYNWWVPKRLERLWRRLGLAVHEGAPA